MALTLIQQETFQGVGALNNASPGNLGTVPAASSFLKRAVGPRLTADTTANSLGWSADLTQGSGNSATCEHSVATAATAAAANGVWSAYYFIDRVIAAGTNPGYLFKAQTSSNLRFVEVYCKGGSANFFYNPVSGEVDSGVAIPTRAWFELRLYWRLISGTNYSLDVAYRLCGGSTWTTIFTNTNKAVTRNIDHIVSGLANSLTASASKFNARYGMPSLYSAASDADARLAVSGVIDPPVTPTTWYLNPSTGSDSNDGVTAASAWQTVAKFNAESLYCGLFPASTYAAGDTLELDTSGAALDLGGTAMAIKTPGINIRPPSGQTYADVKPWKDISAATWALESGTAHVYSTTDGGATDKVGVVIWEDDKWLTHPTGAAFTNVSATMDATPGSFYSDGTKIYLHPLGSTVPGADGKVYTRSRNYGAGLGNSAIDITVPDVHVKGIRCGKTCLARSTDHDPYVGYPIQVEGVDGGTSLFEGLYLYYWSKHALGFTGDTLTRTYTVQDSQFEQGSPYSSQTMLVDYTSQTANGSCVSNYLRCTSNFCAGRIGSAGGSTMAQLGTSALYSHNSGTGTQFTQNVTDCNFPNGTIASAYPAVAALTVTTSTYAGGTSSAAACTVRRCRLPYGIPVGGNGTGTTLLVENCLLPLTVLFNTGLQDSRGVNGTATFRGCTFDLTGVASGDDVGGGIFKRLSAASLTVRDCLFIIASSQAWTVAQAFTSTDTLVLDHNAYVLGFGGKLLRLYNDGTTTADRTLAQAVTLGLDTGSFATTDLLIGGDYIPKPGSPLIGAGTDIGPLADYTGATFAVRKTIGAYEANSVLLGGFFFGG